MTGNTYSSDFPTTPGAFDTSHNWYGDSFVVKLALPTSSGVDAYVHLPALVGAPPAGIATIPIQYGNNGATTATSVTLTATLSSSLAYVGDTSGVTPALDDNTVTWNLPDLAFQDSGQFILRVSLPSIAPIGTRYPVTWTLASAGPEADPSDNAANTQVMAAWQAFLPLILRNR